MSAYTLRLRETNFLEQKRQILEQIFHEQKEEFKICNFVTYNLFS